MNKKRSIDFILIIFILGLLLIFGGCSKSPERRKKLGQLLQIHFQRNQHKDKFFVIEIIILGLIMQHLEHGYWVLEDIDITLKQILIQMDQEKQ